MCTSKVCSKCGIEKPSSAFHLSGKPNGSLYSHCKECKKAYRSKRYYAQKANDPIRLWAHRGFHNAKYRAKKSGIPFTLTKEDVTQLVSSQSPTCTYCEVELNFQLYSEDMKDRWDAPSLDRLDPALGYILGNTVLSCYRCNAIKSDATHEELVRIALKVQELIEENNKD